VPARTRNRKRLVSLLGAVLAVTVLSVALWSLHGELVDLSRESVFAHIRSIPTSLLLASIGFAACSYFVLTGYDATALKYLNRSVPYRRTALTSFMAYAVGHNVGIVALSGGSIRFRMYTLAGLTASEITQLIVFLTMTFGIGASGLLGTALLVMPASQTAVLKLPPAALTAAGFTLLAVPVLYVAAALLRREPLRVGDWRIAMPGPAVALSQVVVSVADLMFASLTFYVLLDPILDIGYFPFLGIYLLAMGAGVLSNVPGGIGVFEAVVVAALPQLDTSALLGTMIVYRLIYYVAPLTLALLFLIAHESRQHAPALRRAGAEAGGWLFSLAPQMIGVAVFLAGVVLLVSGASPAIESRLSLISKGIPLPLLELSHMTGSLIGTALLILARGLFRRLHGAYLAALGALAAGAIVSLMKGLDYEEALILSGIFVVLWLSRGEFYRRESISGEPLSVAWILAIACVLGLALWVGFVSFRHVEYSNELWWQFASNAEAPRMLRAALVTSIAALGFVLWVALKGRSAPPLPVATGDGNTSIRRVLAGTSNSSANAALLGDKRFLWSQDESAFIMYQVSGRSWIALGDPVGPAQHREDLVWRFRELVDRNNGRTVFYEVSDECLPLYVDLGLSLSKLGEVALVDLETFSLQGSERSALRYADNRAKRDGAAFEIVPQAGIDPIISELRRISDSWLAGKSTAEKGFSLGAFSEEYVRNFDCAVVRLENEIVAFANLWPAPGSGELSIDLMRYDQRAPRGVMDFLFVELMLWAAGNGYRSFNLGMAPLAGLEHRPLAPLWHKLGHLIFTHGENFYNFEGLRQYKEKFTPVWKPRYLACPGGLMQLPQSLFDAARLISGGLAGVLGGR